MNFQRVSKIIGGAGFSIVLLIGLNGCSSTKNAAPTSQANPEMPTSSSFASSTVCANNPFLQKYRCSFSQVEQAARSGDPDAQYALGYLYYYGIGTTQDRQTGLVWIRKAAAQGQTVAQEALSALSTKPSAASSAKPASKQVVTSKTSAVNNSSSTASASGNSSAAAANPEKPLTDYLPNYGEKRVDTTSTPPMINLSAPPATQN